MTQPFKIQLNVDALAALFPAGSEARVELQQAVIAEFMRKHIKESALGPDIQLRIDNARRDAFHEVERAQESVTAQVLTEYGVSKSNNWGSSVTVKGEAKEAIEREVRNNFDNLVRTQLSEAITAKLASMKADIDRISEARIQQLVDKEITTAVKARVESVMRNLSLGGPAA